MEGVKGSSAARGKGRGARFLHLYQRREEEASRAITEAIRAVHGTHHLGAHHTSAVARCHTDRCASQFRSNHHPGHNTGAQPYHKSRLRHQLQSKSRDDGHDVGVDFDPDNNAGSNPGRGCVAVAAATTATANSESGRCDP